MQEYGQVIINHDALYKDPKFGDEKDREIEFSVFLFRFDLLSLRL